MAISFVITSGATARRLKAAPFAASLRPLKRRLGTQVRCSVPGPAKRNRLGMGRQMKRGSRPQPPPPIPSAVITPAARPSVVGLAWEAVDEEVKQRLWHAGKR